MPLCARTELRASVSTLKVDPVPADIRPSFHASTLRRGLAGILTSALALAGVVVATESATAAAGSPVPDGIYLDSPWVKPGGTVWLEWVGEVDCDVDGYSFVSGGTTTILQPNGLGEGAFFVARGAGFVNEEYEPLTLGSTGAVTGALQLTCAATGGGSATVLSFPLTVSPTAPSSIYHSWGSWAWLADQIVPGKTITVSALGFKPGETATVSLIDWAIADDQGGDIAGAFTTPVTSTADGEGGVTTQVTIPAGWAEGDTIDLVIGGASSRYLLVSGAGEPSFGDASITIDATGSAFAGGAVTVSAAGYQPGETVQIALHRASGKAIPIGTLVANSAGKVSGSLYLPGSLAAGGYRLWVGAKTVGYLLQNQPLTIGAKPTVARVSGDDRFATAVATAQSFAPFPSGEGVVYLTSGRSFPDALGAGALAAQLDGPVLLTEPNALPASVKAELLRLRPAVINVVGGTSAVSAAVFSQVQKLGFTHDTVRIGGADRYATNRALISAALEEASTVYIAVGSNFPDALAAGPAAAKLDGAVVLVNGTASSLDDATLDLIESLAVVNIRLVGGTAAISSGIENQLKSLYPGHVTRVAGADRYDTAAKIVAGAWPGTAEQVLLASGANFPDALAAGALGIPMLTTPANCIPAGTLAQLGALHAGSVSLVGGPAALSAAIGNFQHC
jgi:putative cell wall-binding protein